MEAQAAFPRRIETNSPLTGELVCLLKENITPKSVYWIYECKVDSSTVSFGGMTVSSHSLAGHLKGCRRIVLLAATLGTSADMLIRKYSVQDIEKALIAQGACAAMIEAYLDETEKDFSQEKELKGLFPVTRYSPGYGDFDIACQKDILNLLDAWRIGLSSTDGFMLIPSKSVTAVIGFSEEQKQCSQLKQCAAKCAVCAYSEDTSTYKKCGFRGAV